MSHVTRIETPLSVNSLADSLYFVGVACDSDSYANFSNVQFLGFFLCVMCKPADCNAQF